MDNLNLPDKLRALEEATKNWYGNRHLFVMPNTIEQLLTALSDARDELHKKDCIIGDLVSDKKGLRDEIDVLKEENGLLKERIGDWKEYLRKIREES